MTARFRRSDESLIDLSLSQTKYILISSEPKSVSSLAPM